MEEEKLRKFIYLCEFNITERGEGVAARKQGDEEDDGDRKIEKKSNFLHLFLQSLKTRPTPISRVQDKKKLTDLTPYCIFLSKIRLKPDPNQTQTRLKPDSNQN